MAQQFGSDQPIDPIRIGIERSRERLARDVRGLRYEIDIPARIRRSFQQQTTLWVVAAVAVGAVLVALPGMRKKVYVDLDHNGKPKRKLLQTGFLLGALRIAATMLKPAVVSFIHSRMNQRGRASSRPSAGW